MDVRQLYNQLLDEIHADETALEEKRELARLLKKRISPEATHSAQLFSEPKLPQQASRIDGEAVSRARPLAQVVEEAVVMLAGQEFVVGSVADVIRDRMGIPLPDRPNTAISTVLRRLEAGGVIVKTFTGAGNVPNRYRLAGEVNAAEQQQIVGASANDIA